MIDREELLGKDCIITLKNTALRTVWFLFGVTDVNDEGTETVIEAKAVIERDCEEFESGYFQNSLWEGSEDELSLACDEEYEVEIIGSRDAMFSRMLDEIKLWLERKI